MNLAQLHAGFDWPSATKRSAEIKAVLVKSYLEEHIGGEWKIMIYRATHWCFFLTLGSVHLSCNGYEEDVVFLCHISKIKGDPSHLNDIPWFSSEDSSNDPVKAIDNAMKRARDYVKSLHETLNNNKFLMMQVNRQS